MTSAYNLGNIGLATKLLWIKDLILARMSASDGSWEIEVVGSGFADGRMRWSLRKLVEGLGVGSGILPIWPVEISQ